MIPIAMLYGTPEDSADQIAYLKARGYPISYIEMGEEPDGQFMLPEQYGALYLQWATALHHVDPTLKLGGPIFEGVNEDIQVWPDAQGKTSWLGRFIDYLKAHGRLQRSRVHVVRALPVRALQDSVEQPLRRAHADQPHSSGLARRRLAAKRSHVHLRTEHCLEHGRIFRRTSSAALWLADFVGSFSRAGWKWPLLLPLYSRVGLSHGCGSSMGTFALFTVDTNYQIQQPTSQFFASQLINLEWVQPGTAEQQLFPASADIADPAGHKSGDRLCRAASRWPVGAHDGQQRSGKSASHHTRVSRRQHRTPTASLPAQST